MNHPRRRLLWLAVVAVLAWPITGAGRAGLDNLVKRWSADEDRVMVAIDQLRARFGSLRGLRRFSR